jgi:hypothetical protein
MSDMIKIKRKERIYLEEWILTVNSLDNIRLCKEKFHVGKDADGKAFRTPVEEGDTEIYVEDQDKWINVFHYRDEEYCIAFDLPQGATETKIWAVAADIARALEARMVGDDGESYDPDTLEPNSKADVDGADDVEEVEEEFDDEEDVEEEEEK